MSLKRIFTFGVCSMLLSQAWGSIETRDYKTTCQQVKQAISSASHVYFPGSLHYTKDINHYATSSIQYSACSVEPSTAEDVAAILKVVGSTRTPFAVKGGGHATNQGFSSTPGVHIAMSSFSAVVYDAASQTVEVGAGLIWDDVYAALEDDGVNVIGGRVSGVGVAGFSLGGGYSWKSNQYGLTVDNIVGYELVLPNGTITSVTASSAPDLFFGLKGGYNNFGIVTKFTMKAYPQTQVWGGIIIFSNLTTSQINAATTKFAETVTDPKAASITSYNYVLGSLAPSVLLFYDGPTPPSGIFDDFLAIPGALSKDISTRSFLSLVKASPGTDGSRGVYASHSVVDYPIDFLNAVVNETSYWGPLTGLHSATLISYAIEPFLPTLFSHNITATAYPPDRTRSVYPFNVYFAWTLPTSDAYMQDAIRKSVATLVQKADAEGQNIGSAPVYPNYAIYDTPLEAIYGDGLGRLRGIKQVVDPGNVMGLAGGFKF